MITNRAKWSKTREKILITWSLWEGVAEDCWDQLTGRIKPRLDCDPISRCGCKIYSDRIGQGPKTWHGIEILFEEQWETIEGVTFCVFKGHSACWVENVLEGSKHRVKHTVRRFLVTVGLTGLRWVIVAEVENRAGLSYLGSLTQDSTQDLFLAWVWEMREVIKDEIQVSDFETKWMTMPMHLLIRGKLGMDGGR